MQLLIILLIVALIFGTKKLRNMGGDLGGAVKGFKKALKDEDKAEDENTMKKNTMEKSADNIIEGKSEKIEETKEKNKSQ